jgi:hypothetical protein
MASIGKNDIPGRAFLGVLVYVVDQKFLREAPAIEPFYFGEAQDFTPRAVKYLSGSTGSFPLSLAFV